MDAQNSKRFNFFLKGSGTGVLLIHGITGTPSEMRYLGKCLNKAGFTVFCNTLPRHCSTLAELKKVTWQEIASACMEDFRYLKRECDTIFVGGISMGAIMSIHLAYKFPQETSGIIALAPTVFYDGWAIHKGRFLMEIFWHIPFVRRAINIRESWTYEIGRASCRERV